MTAQNIAMAGALPQSQFFYPTVKLLECHFSPIGILFSEKLFVTHAQWMKT
jgi:hypothetical protein